MYITCLKLVYQKTPFKKIPILFSYQFLIKSKSKKTSFPVLFLAGKPGQTGINYIKEEYFQKLVFQLKQDYDNILLDQCGSGSSLTSLPMTGSSVLLRTFFTLFACWVCSLACIPTYNGLSILSSIFLKSLLSMHLLGSEQLPRSFGSGEGNSFEHYNKLFIFE